MALIAHYEKNCFEQDLSLCMVSERASRNLWNLLTEGSKSLMEAKAQLFRRMHWVDKCNKRFQCMLYLNTCHTLLSNSMLNSGGCWQKSICLITLLDKRICSCSKQVQSSTLLCWLEWPLLIICKHPETLEAVTWMLTCMLGMTGSNHNMEPLSFLLSLFQFTVSIEMKTTWLSELETIKHTLFMSIKLPDCSFGRREVPWDPGDMNFCGSLALAWGQADF
uniref:Uncharacterized protein n=1 Tax=Oryza meridionalis TaxID=40149 RepID=A0A0E0DB08_9ORYZ